MYFSISAPQNLTLPDGQILSFRVNAQDSSLCEMHIVGVDGNDVAGTHVLTFKRNGGPQDTAFVPAEQPKEQPAYKDAPDERPAYADAPSVDKDAVRGNSWAAEGTRSPP